MSKHTLLIGLVVTVIALTSCGSGGQARVAERPPGNADHGKTLFLEATIYNTPGCTTCHSLEPGKTVVGPSLAGIATRAEGIIESPAYKGSATTVKGFLRESITNPNDFIETHFSHSVMPDWLTTLSEREIDDLVAFLATLK
jgi:cytochrome c2